MMNLIELIQSRRIALTPEYDAGWCAEVYDDQETIQYSGHGFTIDEAITDALGPTPDLIADTSQNDRREADFIRINATQHCPECGHPDCNGQCFGDDMMGSSS